MKNIKIINFVQDFEKEEITITNDEELSSALNLYFLQKFIKFFVHYSSMKTLIFLNFKFRPSSIFRAQKYRRESKHSFRRRKEK